MPSPQPTKKSIAIFTTSAEYEQQATRLARQLDVPVISSEPDAYDLILTLADNGLSLSSPQSGFAPLTIDFTTASMNYRRKTGGGIRQTLARAVGIKGSYRPTIMDATAGLGTDAFILATLGCKLYLMERNPIIFAMLEDAILRLSNRLHAEENPATNLHLLAANSLTMLSGTNKLPVVDCIYLDPMYPHRTKSALPKKNLRLLRMIVGDDPDSDQLLALAQQKATRRVVVKRPRLGQPLAGEKPSFTLSGKSSRFDIYLIRKRGVGRVE